MATEEIDAAAIESLAAKVASLDLSVDERAVLQVVLDRAASADDEVAGFAMDDVARPVFGLAGGLRLSNQGAQWGRAVGFQPPQADQYIGETEKNLSK